MSEVLTLEDNLLFEIERVQELFPEYEKLPNGNGKFSIHLVKLHIAKGLKAIIEGDIPGMTAVYQELKGWKI
jgi:hypothetical protein